MALVSIPPFEEFYEANRDRVYKLLVRRVGRQQAEDAFQETFLRALRAYAGLRHAEQLGAWVTTIAERVVIDAHRRGRSTDELGDSRDLGWPPAARGARAPCRRAAADRARRGRPSLRLRPRLRPDRRRAGVERDRGEASGLGRCPPSAKGVDMTVPTKLDERFRDAASAAGLLDAAYDVTESPIGELLVATTDRGVCWIEFGPEETLDRLQRQVGARLLRVPRRLTPVRRELDEYFSGDRTTFDVDVDLAAVPDVPAARAGRARARPVRRGDDVRRAREPYRQAAGRARRRRRAQPEPCADHRPVSPRDRRFGQPRRLCGRPRAQADAASAGRRRARLNAGLTALLRKRTLT